MPLDPAREAERTPADAPAPLALAAEPLADAGPCRAPAALGELEDHELYALEADRCLEPAEWQRVEAELRRRRQSRRVTAADVSLGVPVPPSVTLNDLERVSLALEERLAERVAALDRRARALRWWTMAAPLAWGLVGLAAWGMTTHDGAGWAALAAALMD